MMLMSTAPHHEGAGILPSLSNVLHAMRTSNKHEEAGADHNTAMWNHVQQLNMWGASSLAALQAQHSGARSPSSAHSGGDSRSTTDSGPATPGDNSSEDEKPELPRISTTSRRLTIGAHKTAGLGGAAGKASATATAANRDASNDDSTTTPGFQYWPGRKWRERRDKKYGGEEDTRQSAHLRVAVLGLQKALTTTIAKSELMMAVRKYTQGQSTPEEFAETIKHLVDAHNVIVPTGTLVPNTGDNSGRKRALDTDHANAITPSPSASSARAGRNRDNKRSKNKNSPMMRVVGSIAVPPPSMNVTMKEEGNGAWEALVSVCSML